MSEIFSKILKDKNGKTLNVGSKYQQPEWGSEGEKKELYPEMTLAPMAADEPMAPIATAPTNMPVIGDTVKIMWNGTEYTCTGVMFSEDGVTNMGVMFGNAGAMIPDADVTDEPFLFAVIAPELAADMGAYAMCVIFDGSTSVTFSASIGNEVIHKIDEKFLPIQKTHWVNDEDVVIYPEMTVTEKSEEDFLIRTKPADKMLVGCVYKVILNGEEYELEALPPNNGMEQLYQCVIDLEGVFTITIFTSFAAAALGSFGTIGLASTADSVTFSIIEPKGTVHKLDAKYQSVASVNGKTGDVQLTAADVGADEKGAAASQFLLVPVTKGTALNSVSCAGAAGESETYKMGISSVAIGEGNQATGRAAFAAGRFSTAKGFVSTTFGYGTMAIGESQFAQGRYNVEDTMGKYALILGNGTSDTSRSNAHTLDWEGNAWFAGTVEGTALILKSSTEGSTKRFKITVDDSGTLSATEIT